MKNRSRNAIIGECERIMPALAAMRKKYLIGTQGWHDGYTQSLGFDLKLLLD